VEHLSKLRLQACFLIVIRQAYERTVQKRDQACKKFAESCLKKACFILVNQTCCDTQYTQDCGFTKTFFDPKTGFGHQAATYRKKYRPIYPQKARIAALTLSSQPPSHNMWFWLVRKNRKLSNFFYLNYKTSRLFKGFDQLSSSIGRQVMIGQSQCHLSGGSRSKGFQSPRLLRLDD